MNRIVHILASCRNPNLLDMTLLVFRTLRVGFPTAKVHVWVNQMAKKEREPIVAAIRSVGAQVVGYSYIDHDTWIERLLDRNSNDIAICDTDMVFHESVEDWEFDRPLAGALEPGHVNPYTRAVHVARLHTSLLFLRPVEIRDQVRAWESGLPGVPNRIQNDLISQKWIPQFNAPLKFCDTTALLFHAIGGRQFTDQQRDAFSHLHCGTWSDQVIEAIPDLQLLHHQAVENPQSARGIWRRFEEFYARNQD